MFRGLAVHAGPPCLLLIALAGCATDPAAADASSELDAARSDGAVRERDGGDTPDDAGPPTDASSLDAFVPSDADGLDGFVAPDANVSTGCGEARPPGFSCADVTFEGATRRWCMNVPESYDAMRPYSIVLGLHGCGGNETRVHTHRAPMEAYGAEDFLFAYPKAQASCWSAADLPFLRHVIETVSDEHCVARGSVFVHGMSSGGSMAARVASAGMVKAFASVSAGGNAPAMPAWYYGGQADPAFARIVAARERQSSTNGCAASSTAMPGTPCVRFDACEHEMIYCEDGRGHVWPAEDWAQAGIIDFFRAVP